MDSDTDHLITDQDDGTLLDSTGSPDFLHADDIEFTGYTVTLVGQDYPVFNNTSVSGGYDT